MNGKLAIAKAVGQAEIEAMGFAPMGAFEVHVYSCLNDSGDAVRGSVICVRRVDALRNIVNVYDSYWTLIKSFTFNGVDATADATAFCLAAVKAKV